MVPVLIDKLIPQLDAAEERLSTYDEKSSKDEDEDEEGEEADAEYKDVRIDQGEDDDDDDWKYAEY